VIYICADDYGLNNHMSARIQECVDQGALNKVSIFPNFDKLDLDQWRKNQNLSLSLHLNLVEGNCMADATKINLLADENGKLKHTFGGLFRLNLFESKKLEEQAYREIKAQVLFWKSNLPKDAPFLIDSHQHTHMIPAVFRALVKVLKDENIPLQYLRIPAEPVMPYLKTPSLYFTYSPVNLIKQWLLKLLWQKNKGLAKKHNIPTAYFFGILFSGKMDEKRVKKVLPKYQELAEKKGRNIEILFHPGYFEKKETEFLQKNIVFSEFYFSQNRKTEFDSVINLSERGVF